MHYSNDNWPESCKYSNSTCFDKGLESLGLGTLFYLFQSRPKKGQNVQNYHISLIHFTKNNTGYLVICYKNISLTYTDKDLSIGSPTSPDVRPFGA